ncbi:hypothetical protein ACI6Q7_16560, partial [Pseudomonas amygdali pv. tabaci]
DLAVRVRTIGVHFYPLCADRKKIHNKFVTWFPSSDVWHTRRFYAAKPLSLKGLARKKKESVA